MQPLVEVFWKALFLKRRKEDDGAVQTSKKCEKGILVGTILGAQFREKENYNGGVASVIAFADQEDEFVGYRAEG